MMYCLRSYIPLLILPLPLSLSPIHLTVLLGLIYFLNRPCIYCSFLLLILFASSCGWSNRCFVDFSYKPISEGGAGIATWFIPRLYTTGPGSWSGSRGEQNSTDFTDFLVEVANNTVAALASVALQNAKRGISGTMDFVNEQSGNNTGVGLGWLRTILGRSEWTLPCTEFKIVL